MVISSKKFFNYRGHDSFCHPITGPQPTSKLESQFLLKKRTSKNLYSNYSESKNSMYKKMCLMFNSNYINWREQNCLFLHSWVPLDFQHWEGLLSCVDTVANFQQITSAAQGLLCKTGQTSIATKFRNLKGLRTDSP